MNLSATISLTINLTDTIAAGSTVGQSYPVSYKPTAISQTYLTSYGAGTPGYAAKFAFENLSAAAAVSTTDLTAVTCSDATTSFAHVRELFVFNDDPTHSLTLTFVTNTFTAQYATGTETIPPNSYHRMPPVIDGANGLVVDATHKFVQVDPGANTIAYRVLAIGD